MLEELLEYFRPSRRVRHEKASSRKAPARKPAHRNHPPAAHARTLKSHPLSKAQAAPPTLWQKLTQPTDFNLFLCIFYIVMLLVILFIQPAQFQHGRWDALLDLNRDGQFTITDLFYWCFWLFYLPGDVLISILMQMPGPAAFFELDGQSFGGIGSLMVSMLYWWLMGGPKLLIAGMLPIIIQTFLRA